MSAPAETITIGEKTYTVLYPDLIRPLTPQEREQLRDSIEKHGIKHEITIDPSNGIIDGANRTRIANELGLQVIPTRTVECANEEEKRDLALSLNISRRHLSPEEREKLIEARRERVRQARDGGDSLRSIGAKEGISEKQVRKDLAASGADQSAPETTPEAMPANLLDSSSDDPVSPSDVPAEPTETSAPPKILGRDGKRYARTRNPVKGRKGGKPPAACKIKGLAKEIKTLVEQGRVETHVAEAFARTLDRETQTRLVAGKDATGIAEVLREWRCEQTVIERVKRLASGMASVLSHEWSRGVNWHIDRASPEGRKIIVEQLRQARTALEDQIRAVEALAS